MSLQINGGSLKIFFCVGEKNTGVRTFRGTWNMFIERILDDVYRPYYLSLSHIYFVVLFVCGRALNIVNKYSLSHTHTFNCLVNL